MQRALGGNPSGDRPRDGLLGELHLGEHLPQ